MGVGRPISPEIVLKNDTMSVCDISHRGRVSYIRISFRVWDRVRGRVRYI